MTGTVGVTFTLYKEAEDNVALWVETQNAQLDENGRYSVLLGATKKDGVPAELFASGGARWLGVRPEGHTEQPRVLLVSVPYALRAAEADALAGHSANEFVTADHVATIVKQQMQENVAARNQAQSTAREGAPAVSTPQGPTQFTGTTTNNIVSVVQSGTGAGLTAIAPGTAVYGDSTNATGSAYGVRGSSVSANGFGVFGFNGSATGIAVGIFGQSNSIGGVGLSGLEAATSGYTKGVIATVNSASGVAAVVQNTAGGKLVSAQSGSAHTEVFSVDGNGNVSGAGNLTGAALSGGSLAVTANAAIGGALSAGGGSVTGEWKVGSLTGGSVAMTGVVQSDTGFQFPGGAVQTQAAKAQPWTANFTMPASVTDVVVGPALGRDLGQIVSSAAVKQLVVPVPQTCAATNFKVAALGIANNSGATVGLGALTLGQVASGTVVGGELSCILNGNKGAAVTCSNSNVQILNAGTDFLAIFIDNYYGSMSDLDNAQIMVSFTCD